MSKAAWERFAAELKAWAAGTREIERRRRCHRFNKDLQRDLEYGRRG